MSSVIVSRAPEPLASPAAASRTGADGWSSAGAQILASIPSSAPVTSSELAVLFRPSPR